jgi:hypothetical protein
MKIFMMLALLAAVGTQPSLTFAKEVMEGQETNNGGHILAVKFTDLGRNALNKIEEAPEVFPGVNVAEFRELLREGNTKILVVDKENFQKVGGVIQKSPLANNAKLKSVYIYEQGFEKMLSDDREHLEALVLHELASLKGIDSTGIYRLTFDYLEESQRRKNGGSFTAVTKPEYKIISRAKDYAVLFAGGGALVLPREAFRAYSSDDSHYLDIDHMAKNFLENGNRLDDKSRLTVSFHFVMDHGSREPVKYGPVFQNALRNYFRDWQNVQIESSILDVILQVSAAPGKQALVQNLPGLRNARVKGLQPTLYFHASGNRIVLERVSPSVDVKGEDIVLRNISMPMGVKVEGKNIHLEDVKENRAKGTGTFQGGNLQVKGEDVRVVGFRGNALIMGEAKNIDLQGVDVGNGDALVGSNVRLKQFTSKVKMLYLPRSLDLTDFQLKAELTYEQTECFGMDVSLQNMQAVGTRLTVKRPPETLGGSCHYDNMFSSAYRAKRKTVRFSAKRLDGMLDQQLFDITTKDCSQWQYTRSTGEACFEEEIAL